jgi:hypothetical protein
MQTKSTISNARLHAAGDAVRSVPCYSLSTSLPRPLYITANSWLEALHLAMPEPRFVLLRLKSTGAFLAAWLNGEGEIQSTAAATKDEVMEQARQKWREAVESCPADLVRPIMSIPYRRLSAEGWLARQGEQAWESLMDLLGRIRSHLQRREVFGQFLDRFTIGVPPSERAVLMRRLEQLPS